MRWVIIIKEEQTTNRQLLKEINLLRDKLIATGINKGLNHNETLKISQKLDQVLNEYYANLFK